MKLMKRCVAILIVFAVFGAATAFGAEEAVDTRTYAERLGWEKGSRVVIFHCDDAGMCHSANVGVIEALEYGLLTSVSTMMPCSWVPEFAAYLKEHPNVDNGLHLTFTSEWTNYRWGPVAGKAAVPGLADEQGCLWDNIDLVGENASAAEVETELRAQIDRAEAMGMPITHLDSHMGTLFSKPEYFLTYMNVGIEKGIPILVPGGHLQYISQEETGAAEALKQFGVPQQVWDAGLPVIDDIHADGYDWKDSETKKAKLIEFLRDVQPGITEFILHCTRPGDEFEHISTSGSTRLADLEVMTDPEIKAIIEEEGIILTTWRDLKERRDAIASPKE